MTTILLARHGETDWNHEGRFQGHADPALNATGRAQAAELAAELEAVELAAVYSSPLQRALETAEVVAAEHGLQPVAVDALREVDVGSWEGLTRAEVEARFPEQFAGWLDYDQGWADGESYEEMARRVVAALLELAGAHEGERILAVTHGGPIRAAFAFADGTSHADARRLGPRIGNVFLAEFAVEGEALRRLD
ncbi:MAG TPA: histidine phosphatase family protein [Gaiellaceae bacterium]|nr:histidine phosphatase family protein [Gaiellaceae bacterium]